MFLRRERSEEEGGKSFYYLFYFEDPENFIVLEADHF
jgi:hypothetical protein